MPMTNADIAVLLDELADLLEIAGENPFKVRAYRNAARTVGELPKSVVSTLAEQGDLPHLPGIGESIAGKIKEIARTGHLSALEEMERQLPDELPKLMTLPGLGPKRVKILFEQLGITSFQDLAQAVGAQKIRQLPGFGKKTEERIREELERRVQSQPRIKLAVAEQVAEPLVRYLKGIEEVQDVVIAGSYRRRLETVGDLDILVASQEKAGIAQQLSIMEKAAAYEDVDEILSKGETRSTLRLKSGLQIDLRVISEASYGAALHYFTGSKAHNIVIRTMAIERGLKINEYGVFRGNRRIAGSTEQEIFRQVDLPYIEPELRENRGEIEAAQRGQLPRLVTLQDIRGDLHVHTQASDGRQSIEEMAIAARARGYEYIAITDHTKHTVVAHGLDEARFQRHLKEIDRVNAQLEDIFVLKSAEVDILEDGSLDLPDAILREMDLTVCSIHSQFGLPMERQTERIIRAMDNPWFNIFGHPTGRLINQRAPYAIDMERIMKAALERGCFLELNAHPDRLDLNDIHCRMAKEMGLQLVISTDAHRATDFAYMRYGIDQARRGWLEPEDVLNTYPWEKLRAMLRRI